MKDQRPASRLSAVAGYVLLLELLEEEGRGDWLTFIHRRLTPAALSSDEEFEKWMKLQRIRDPSLVTRVRRVLISFGRDLQLAPGRGEPGHSFWEEEKFS